MGYNATGRRVVRVGVAASLLATCASVVPVHAEPSMADIAAQIKALRDENREIKAQNNQMKQAISELRGDNRKTREKVRSVVERAPKGYAPPPLPVYANGAVPTLVTPDKKFIFGNLTITPGGFLAMESAFRTRTEQADIGSQYPGIPFGPQAATNELRFTARQSRIAALVEAPISSSYLVSGYGEFDFLGSGATSNYNESNSYVPRIRHLYATLDNNDYGMHVLAGQNWSLATLNSKGITPRNEVTPPSIDAQYVPGFVWKRQPQIRLTKDFNKKLWLSISAESPQNTIAGCTGGIGGTAVAPVAGGTAQSATCDLPGANNLNGTVATQTNGATTVTGGEAITNFSLNHVPDVIGKAAYEARIADRDVHFEGFGLYRDLYDRVTYANAAGAQVAAGNQNTTGYGVGGGLIVPLLPKRLDLQVSGIYGRGIGSYGTAQFSDSTFNTNGSLSPIREEMLLAGLTAHVTSAIDLYAFGGVEQVQPDYYPTNAAQTAFNGYGAPTANNSGCFNVVSTTVTCAGNTKRIWQITGGMWDKIYKGQFGEVRVGLQYSYTQRELFQGNAFTAPAGPLPFAPKQNENTVLTSLRYYPFQ